MFLRLKNSLRAILKILNIGLTSHSKLEKLKKHANFLNHLELLNQLNFNNTNQLLYFYPKSKSQNLQDLFVLSHLAFKRNGYFVDFGASNGIDLSNSYLMEKDFGWNGILCEPAKLWHKDLKKNRNCQLELNCVWRDSVSLLDFNEAYIPEFSSISDFSDTSLNKKARKNYKHYKVKTISLFDLLEKYNAPCDIDYLSIDTEGSEYEILKNFNFSKYTFKLITCEHNFSLNREKIYTLLKENGYIRVFKDYSLFDDWYVHATLASINS